MAQQAPLRDDELIGTSLGHCDILDLIGEGGMARVYRARQTRLDRLVALKVLPPQFVADKDFVERFQLEARSMGRLAHPNIVTVHDAGTDRGRLYIVMEFLAGGNLKQLMRGRPLASGELLSIVSQIASALQYAHEHDIIHRDVKPMNVLLDGHGRAVLSDFGIAKVIEHSDVLTRVGAGVGTPEYMSPEQCRGVPIDSRADIYALGCMVYEMLTGRPPFVADNYTALAHAHIYEQPVPPALLNARISPAVQSVVLTALAKSPAERFQRALDMASSLQQALAAQSPMMGMAAQQGPLLWVRCPACGAQNASRQVYCSSCGTALPHPGASSTGRPLAPVVCPHCQTSNSPHNQHCTGCGAPLRR